MDIEKTLQDLRAKRGEWASMARQSGVSYSWITKFGQGRIPDPRNSTLAKLKSVLYEQPEQAPHP